VIDEKENDMVARVEEILKKIEVVRVEEIEKVRIRKKGKEIMAAKQ
jgi:hypothetical protein